MEELSIRNTASLLKFASLFPEDVAEELIHKYVEGKDITLSLKFDGEEAYSVLVDLNRCLKKQPTNGTPA